MNKSGVLYTSIILLLLTIGANAQDQCPADKVCITPTAARKAIENAATVKAQAEQIKTLEQAVNDEKEVANKLKVEYAETKGELTAIKQNDVANRAIIELLLKSVKKKCLPFSVCF